MSTDSLFPPIPEGQYPPFAVVTDTDHAAWIIIATAVGLAMIFLFSVIKWFIRHAVSVTVALDELFLTIATVFGVIQSSIVLGACAKGLGKSIELITDSHLVEVQKMYYAGLLFFILAIGFSKVSVAFLLLRLTPQKKHRQAFYGIVALLGLWTVASVFTIAFQCNLSHPWILVNEQCPRAFLRWQLISVFDIGFELALVVMTIYLVWKLQTSLENKLTVVFAFSMRLPLLIAIGFRLADFDTGGLTTNPTLSQAKFIVWTQTELCYSIIAATIPSLRPFMKTLSSNFGATNGADGYGYGSGFDHDGTNLSQEPGYQLTSFRPKGKGDEYKYRVWSGKNGTTNKSQGGGSATRSAVQRSGDNVSVGSSDSQRMIIKKDLTWQVHAEQPGSTM